MVRDLLKEALFDYLTVGLAEFIADCHGLDANELTETIEKYLDQHPAETDDLVFDREFKPIITVKNVCDFVNKKGPLAGQVCGAKIRASTAVKSCVNGKYYCSKHRKAVGQ